MTRIPILCTEDEMIRLHSLAYATAIQTGAKGYELDEITSEIFIPMLKHANREVEKAEARPKLSLVS